MIRIFFNLNLILGDVIEVSFRCMFDMGVIHLASKYDFGSKANSGNQGSMPDNSPTIV
jgi:hypothetical protein